jgi:peptidoglycan/LPS O-acetylase OafA/YrhL
MSRPSESETVSTSGGGALWRMIAPRGPGYRTDIQGLRAVAVVLVVLDHAQIPGVTGGYVGVDVFFVISGFLITGLLLSDAGKNHRVRFASFYARRARRILPAATLVILATSLASVFLLNFVAARRVLTDSVWAAFFAANIHFAQEGTNYFTAATATVSPLQHYWSLAVEEQFYLVWPAVLGITIFGWWTFVRGANHRRKPHRDGLPTVRIAVVLLLIGAGSLYLSVVQTASDPHAAYFSTIDRAWELAIGALLAVGLPLLQRIPEHARSALSWAGLGGIGYVAASFTATTAIPGYAAVLPVMAAAAVIAGGVDAPRLGATRLLSLPPFLLVGAISYSLYLWHWPILIISSDYFTFPLNLAQRLALVGLAFVLSLLSFAFVEYPFQHAKRIVLPPARALVLWPASVSLIIATAILAQPGTQFVSGDGPIANIPATLAVVQAVQAAQRGAAIPDATTPSIASAVDDNPILGDCSGFLRASSALCQYGDPSGTKTFVVFGNSHSAMWIPALKVIAKQAHWRFTPLVKDACGYDIYTRVRHDVSKYNQCVLWYDWAKAEVERIRPQLLVIGAYAQTNDPLWAPGIQSIVTALRPFVKRIVLVSDAPGINVVPAFCLAEPDATQGSCLWPESTQRIQALSIAHNLALSNRIGFVDVESWFCYHHQCPSVINGLIPYTDVGHVSTAYARYIAPLLGAKLGLLDASRPKHHHTSG